MVTSVALIDRNVAWRMFTFFPAEERALALELGILEKQNLDWKIHKSFWKLFFLRWSHIRMHTPELLKSSSLSVQGRLPVCGLTPLTWSQDLLIKQHNGTILSVFPYPTDCKAKTFWKWIPNFRTGFMQTLVSSRNIKQKRWTSTVCQALSPRDSGRGTAALHAQLLHSEGPHPLQGKWQFSRLLKFWTLY